MSWIKAIIINCIYSMYLWAVRNQEDAVTESCWSPLSVAVGQECSQGRLQCSRGRSLHVKFNSTKSCLKALTAQLCIHKINQQQPRGLDRSYCPYSPWQLTTYLERIGFNPTGDNKDVFKLWPLWLCLWDC